MCGIYVHFSDNYPLKDLEIEKLKDGLNKRGPDNFGYNFELGNKLLLAHSRLAIQDLSVLASQPMNLGNSKYTLLFNGEIYNHLELRKIYLKNINFLTDSDTETILRLLDKYEIDKVFSLLDGMVSIVIYSKEEKNLILYRDKSAQKPLYFCLSEDKKSVSVSSNPSLFFKLTKNFKKEYDSLELSNYLRNGFTTPSKTIYKRTFSSTPGKIIKICLRDLKIDFNFASIDGVENIDCNSNEKLLKKNFTKSIQSSLIGQRSCGILLSGGLDSTSVAVGCSELEIISRSYTLFSPKEENFELAQAEKTSLELGFDHIPVELNINDALEVLQQLPTIIDYPNPDPSIISSYIVAKEASKNRDTILLTGDGGDEIFGGYNRYLNYLKRFGYIYKFLPIYMRIKILKRYLRNFSTGFSYKNFEIDNYLAKLINKNDSLLLNLCQLDQLFYMTNHTLPKTDRAFMFFSLEGRAPLLNNFFKSFSKTYLLNNPYSNKKEFLRNYVRNRLGSLYINSYKKGFTPFLDKLAANGEFLNTLISANKKLMEFFIEPSNNLNYDYFMYLNDPKTNFSKRDLRNLWHLFSIVSCDNNY